MPGPIIRRLLKPLVQEIVWKIVPDQEAEPKDRRVGDVEGANKDNKISLSSNPLPATNGIERN